jgi:hypothetical protein
VVFVVIRWGICMAFVACMSVFMRPYCTNQIACVLHVTMLSVATSGRMGRISRILRGGRLAHGPALGLIQQRSEWCVVSGLSWNR